MPSREAGTIRDAISSARDSALDAPLLWIAKSGDVSGDRSYAVEADAGHSRLSWRWDGTRLVVETDPFGMIPGFVYEHDGVVAISTSITRLIAQGATLHVDRDALAVLLRLGFCIGDDTPFREVRTVPPAGLVWQDGRIVHRGAPYLVARADVSRDTAIATSIALMKQAMDRRRPRSCFALPLSAGRDSRHILLSLVHEGYRPEFAITVPRWPPAAPDDVEIATALARVLDLPHVVLDHPPRPGPIVARKNVATDYCAQEHAWFFPMLDYLRGRAPLLYEGIGGSLWNPGWCQESDVRALWRAGRTRQVAARMLEVYGIFSDAVLERLLAEPAAVGREVAIDRLSRELDRHRDAPDPGKSFHFWNRLRRTLSLMPFGQMRQFAEVYTPLVDPDLTNFLLSLEPEIVSPALARRDKTFHSEAIHRSFPTFAPIPFDAKHGAPSDATAHNRALAVAVARHMAARPRRLRLMRNIYVWPRLAYSLLDQRYAEQAGWFAAIVLHLAQLEDALP
jgi:hypothetical protein